MDSTPDRRSTPRATASAWVNLTAVTCRQAAPGAVLYATLTDISRDAAGLVVTGKLWTGDRLTLTGRLFEVPLSAEVVVSSVRQGSEPDETVAGCSFLALDGEQRIAIERILLGRIAQDDLGLGTRFAMGT
jgi:hypothetical protein